MKKKIFFLIIIGLMIISVNLNVYATESIELETLVEKGILIADTDLGLGDLDNYKGTSSDSPSLTQKASNVLGVIQNVGVVISVVMLIVIGIKYMMGSVEEKADYKSALKPYIIGAFVLFTGSILPNIIFKMVQDI